MNVAAVADIGTADNASTLHSTNAGSDFLMTLRLPT